MTAKGSTSQRHKSSCPKNADGPGYAKHKCRGPWAWHLDLGRDPVTGKRVQRTGSGYAREQDAQEALNAAKARLTVTRGRSDGVSLGDWLDQWLAGLHTASPTTTARYESTIRLHLKPILGSIALVDVTPEDIDHLIQVVSAADYQPPGRTSKRYAKQKGLSSASINRIFDCLSAALGVAAKRRLITYSPATVVTPPTERNKPGTAWTPAEAAKFLDAVAEHRLYAAWHLVLLGGARRSEIAGATWDLLDLDNGVWYVQNAHVQVGGTVHAKQPKSAAGLRTVYLDDETVAVLRAHRAQQAKERLAAGPRWADSGHVFTTRTGAPIPPDRLTTAWRTLATQSGLPIIRLHDGRHTSNTTASVYAGVGDQVLIERVGHAGLDVNRRYRHAHEQVHRQAAEAIAAEYRQHRQTGDPGASSQSG